MTDKWFVVSRYRTAGCRSWSVDNHISEIHPIEELIEFQKAENEEHQLLFYSRIQKGEVKPAVMKDIMDNCGELS